MLYEEKKKPGDGMPRLFVDMDGTLAEWRNITLKIDTDEDRAKVLDILNEILLTPGYYSSLKPHEAMIEAVKELAEMDFEIYILSCAIEKDGIPSPITEKIEWLKQYLPFIPEDHRIFVPDGKNKADYIPGGISANDFLLDDYTKNLKDFENAGGSGIKVCNYVNGSKGRWTGSSVSISYRPEEIASAVRQIVSEGRIVKQIPPDKKRDSVAEIDRDSDANSIFDKLIEEKD